jgi:hypothetical protein
MRFRATPIGVDPEQQIGGVLVSRGKGIVFQLLRLNPTKSRYSNRMGFLAGRNSGPVNNQVEVITMVAVSAAGSGSAYVHIDGYAGEQFAS